MSGPERQVVANEAEASTRRADAALGAALDAGALGNRTTACILGQPRAGVELSGAPAERGTGRQDAAAIRPLGASSAQQRLLLSLQRHAGNRAVTSLLRPPVATAPRHASAAGPVTSTPAPETPPYLRSVQLESLVRRAGGWLRGAGSAVGSPFRKAGAFGRRLAGKTEQPTAPPGVPALDAMSPEERIANANKSAGSIEGVAPDWQDAELAEEEPDRHVVTLAVSQSNPNWMHDFKALRTAALRSPFKLARSGGGDEAQEVLARAVLTGRGVLPEDEADQQRMVQELSGGFDQVGHVWVRLASYVGTKPQRRFSYGMYPQKLFDPTTGDTEGGYEGFIKSGPGQIRHPDVDHESDEHKAYRDSEVGADAFDRALGRAQELYSAPPAYVLAGYNCTAFAREIVRAAGASFPGRGVLPGIAFTPANLYWAVMKEWAKGKKGSHVADADREITEQVTEETEERERAGKLEEIEAYRARSSRPRYGKRKEATLFGGRTIRLGNKPDRLVAYSLAADVQVRYVDDEVLKKTSGAVPVEGIAAGDYADYDDLCAAFAQSADPAEHPPATYNLSGHLEGQLRLHGATSEHGALENEVLLDPGQKGKIRLVVEDAMTRRSGRATLTVRGVTWFVALTEVKQFLQEDAIDHEAEHDEEEAAAAAAEPRLSDEARRAAENEVYRLFDEPVIVGMQEEQSLRPLLDSEGVEALGRLSEDARTYLVQVLGVKRADIDRLLGPRAAAGAARGHSVGGAPAPADLLSAGSARAAPGELGVAFVGASGVEVEEEAQIHIPEQGAFGLDEGAVGSGGGPIKADPVRAQEPALLAGRATAGPEEVRAVAVEASPAELTMEERVAAEAEMEERLGDLAFQVITEGGFAAARADGLVDQSALASLSPRTKHYLQLSFGARREDLYQQSVHA